MTPPLSTAIVVAAALLSLTACGNNKADPATTTTKTPVSVAATTTAVVPTTAIGGGGEFCALARSYSDRAKALIGSFGDPAKLRELVAESGSLIAKAQATAPPEIKGDVARLAASSTQLLAELNKVDFDFTKLPPQVVSQIQTPEVLTAGSNLAAYNRRVCGIS